MKTIIKLNHLKDNLIELLFDDICYNDYGSQVPFEMNDTFQLTGKIFFRKENKKFNLYFEGWIEKSYIKYWIPYRDYNQYIVCLGNVGNGTQYQSIHDMKDIFHEERYFNL